MPQFKFMYYKLVNLFLVIASGTAKVQLFKFRPMMKFSFRRFLTVITFVVFMMGLSIKAGAQQYYPGGSGTESNSYQITTWVHLNNVILNVTSHFKLMNDLDENTDGYNTYASSSANSGSRSMMVKSILKSAGINEVYNGGGWTSLQKLIFPA
jgi:hypothetical protein